MIKTRPLNPYPALLQLPVLNILRLLQTGKQGCCFIQYLHCMESMCAQKEAGREDRDICYRVQILTFSRTCRLQVTPRSSAACGRVFLREGACVWYLGEVGGRSVCTQASQLEMILIICKCSKNSCVMHSKCISETHICEAQPVVCLQVLQQVVEGIPLAC